MHGALLCLCTVPLRFQLLGNTKESVHSQTLSECLLSAWHCSEQTKQVKVLVLMEFIS